MADKVKIGIIGCRVIANGIHGPEYERLKDNAEMVAACDLDPDVLNRFCDRFHIPKRYTKIADLLADEEVQAVDICLHNNFHAPVAIEAMRRGKDVYCEKPMAGTYADALSMLEASKTYGRKLHVQLATIYSAGTYAAKQLIDHGDLGHIYHMRSTGFRRRGRPYVDGYGQKEFVNMRTAGGGALIDMGVYHIAQLIYLAGIPTPEKFLGRTFQEIPMDPSRRESANYDVEELVTGMVDFDNGVNMDLIESWAMNLDGLECSSILGSKGGVRLDPFSYHYTKHDIVFNATIDTQDLDYRSETVYPERSYYRSSQGHWVAALQGKCALLPTAEVALQTQLVLEGLYMSSALGRQVTRDEVIAASRSKNVEVAGLYE